MDLIYSYTNKVHSCVLKKQFIKINIISILNTCFDIQLFRQSRGLA